MNFRIKCLMQTIFGIFPDPERINYFAQKYISKKLPPSPKAWTEKFDFALEHHNVFSTHKSIQNSVVYEIGCGWHLSMALAFSSFGYKCIKALDVTDHIKFELVDTIVRYMKNSNLLPNSLTLNENINIKDELKNKLRIDVLVPADSRNTGIDDKSVDFIYSHDVFGHIQPDLIPPIMDECHRILKDDGLISFAINYGDLYAGIDKSITPYNFLKYSERSWKKYNPSLHYVNRLRHKDFLEIFERSGFKVVEANIKRPENWKSMLENIPLDEHFASNYTLEELSIIYSHITLKKA